MDQSSSKLKVLHLLHGNGFGGISTIVSSLVRAQCETSEVEPAVIYGRLNKTILEEYSGSGARLHHVKLGSGYDMSPIAAYRITKIFKQVDILHFHFFHPMYMICAMLSGTTTVYTFHGNFGIHRKKTVKDHIKNFILKYFVRYFVDMVTYNSKYTQNYAELMYSIQNSRTTVIHNGLNIEFLSGDVSQLPEKVQSKIKGKFVVGACGRLVQMKRIDRLISAFAAFQKGKPDVALLIVGDGTLRGSLEQQIRSLGLTDHATITGFQRNALDFESAFNVCGMPSSGEPFGLVALEAMALGKPTIVFEDSGGLVEIIGGCTPENIVSSIEELTERLEAYYARRDRMGEEAARLRSHAKQFHIEKTAYGFVKAYMRALASLKCSP